MTAPTTGVEPAKAIERIVQCPKLPSLPTVALEVLELTRDEGVPMKRIAQSVEHDQALAGKILRTVNSSFYGLSTPCPNIGRAIRYLGLNTVKSLVLGFSLVENFGAPEGAEGFDLTAHWRRAVYGAVAARLIAERTGACDKDEAFIAAMLRDVGALASYIALRDRYEEAATAAAGSHLDLERTEQEILGFTHSEVGGRLAKNWSVPPHIVEAIRLHHGAENASREHREIARVVALASLAADTMSPADRERADELLAGAGKSWFSMDESAVAAMTGELIEGAGELARLFEVDTGEAMDHDRIMAAAEDQKLQLQVAQEREAEQLRASNTELARRTRTDGLTAIGNRAAFDESLRTAFGEASRAGEPLSLAFMDVDRFKPLNDEHGHQAGDAILIELAQRLATVCGDEAEPFRYGGEEFAALMRGVSVDEAAHLADRIRRAVESTPFDLGAVPDTPATMSITISVGVAVLDDATRETFTTTDALLKAADDAVYTAKDSGRNRVCLYEPARDRIRPATSDRSGPLRPSEQGPDRALQVLLVDDDPLAQRLFTTALERNGRARVRIVGSVTDAVRLLHRGDDDGPYTPDLVLTDLVMPGHSGIKLIRFMRSTPSMRMTPVLVLSGSSDDLAARESVEAGANAFIPKSSLGDSPFDAAERILAFWSLAARAA